MCVYLLCCNLYAVYIPVMIIEKYHFKIKQLQPVTYITGCHISSNKCDRACKNQPSGGIRVALLFAFTEDFFQTCQAIRIITEYTRKWCMKLLPIY